MSKLNDTVKEHKVLVGCLTFVVIFVVIAFVLIAMLLGFRSEVVSLRNQIDAQHIANKSNYDTMWKKFREMTQVSEIQAEQFKDVYTDIISGRYQDTNLLFKIISEQNPTLSPEVYNNLQREIASSRNTFDNNQKKLIDIIREYNTRIDTGTGFILNFIFNFQHIDANQFIIASEKTNRAFETGKDDVINLKGE